MTDSDWIEVEPPAPKAKSTEPVRFVLREERNGENRATLLIKTDVLRPLQMANWRCAVRVGRGIKAHQIAIIPASDGKFELTFVPSAKGPSKDTVRLRLPVVDAWPKVEISQRAVRYSIETLFGKQRALVISLPTEIWHSEGRRRP